MRVSSPGRQEALQALVTAREQMEEARNNATKIREAEHAIYMKSKTELEETIQSHSWLAAERILAEEKRTVGAINFDRSLIKKAAMEEVFPLLS